MIAGFSGTLWVAFVFGLALFLGVRLAKGQAEDADWLTLRSAHFEVLYQRDQERATSVSRRAEEDYARVGDVLGFRRRSGFWRGEKRVTIRLFRSKSEFQAATDAPGWASAKANCEAREISGVADSQSFLDHELPHEIGHFVLRDYVGAEKNAPSWLEEGIAQWVEVMRGTSPHDRLISIGIDVRSVSLGDLIQVDMRQLKDGEPKDVAAYYAAVGSFVGFLIETWGTARFRKCCAQIRDGKGSAEALKFTYMDSASSMKTMQEAWHDEVGKARGSE